MMDMEGLEEILMAVEKEFQMGGLSDGLYGEYAIEVAKRHSAALIAECERLTQWKKEASEVMGPVLDYAQGLKITELGKSVTRALIDDHKRLADENESLKGLYRMHKATEERQMIDLRAECERTETRLHEVAIVCATAEQERDEARTQFQQELERHRKTFTQLEQAKREMEGLQKDADRYRWLRDKSHVFAYRRTEPRFGNLDGDVDSAMAKEPTQ